MSTRRSRAPRSTKSRNSEPPREAPVAAQSATVLITAPGVGDATQTSQLRALEAGWDELLA